MTAWNVYSADPPTDVDGRCRWSRSVLSTAVHPGNTNSLGFFVLKSLPAYSVYGVQSPRFANAGRPNECSTRASCHGAIEAVRRMSPGQVSDRNWGLLHDSLCKPVSQFGVY